MTELCVNSVLPIDADELDDMRKMLRDELATPLNRLPHEPVRPLNAYTIAFGERLHVSIRHRVLALYTSRSRIHRLRAPENGSVYVFRDERDRPRSLVKIGSTTNVARRMCQWRAALGLSASGADGGGGTLSLLFSYRTRHVRMAEAIVHALLACQWQANRVNSMTQRRAVEYFDVPDRLALRDVVAAVTRHVDWWMAGGGHDDDDDDDPLWPPTQRCKRSRGQL